MGTAQFLSPGWLVPRPAVATAQAGNLTWTGTISPEAALALRTGRINAHATIVIGLAAGLAGLILLTIIARPRRPRASVAILPPAPNDDAIRLEMDELRGKLREMVGERDRVLAAIGHDVRTPMNSILGICALLLDGDLDEVQRKWLWRIRASCEALLAMLNGMLEIAAAAVDGAEIHREAVDVAALVEEVGEVLRPQAEDKGLDLLVKIDANARWLSGIPDATRLRQVLFNLGGNAIKYTVIGSVEIEVLTVGDEAGQERLRLVVADTGPGIATDEREVIFEQFQLERDDASRGQDGLGLGLALCRGNRRSARRHTDPRKHRGQRQRLHVRDPCRTRPGVVHAGWPAGWTHRSRGRIVGGCAPPGRLAS